MSYLLDDKKILLKELFIRNEDIKRENENIELENRAFLKLIENYEEKAKLLKVLPYIHHVCTSLYSVEDEINFNLTQREFASELNQLLDEAIENYKQILKNILTKSEKDGGSPTTGLSGHHLTKDQLTSRVYNVDMDDLDAMHAMVCVSRGANARDTLVRERPEGKDPPGGATPEEQHDQTAEQPPAASPCKTNEKNICLHWEREESTGEFYSIQSFEAHEDIHRSRLNLPEKQQLTVNEIEKLKEKIKKNTVYYDNAKTMISSMITQCKILLFELDEDIKNYNTWRERMKNDSYIMKRKHCLTEFFSGILQNHQHKVEEARNTNHTLLNLYKKKFSSMTYIITINENINNVDFRYLHVLIHNQKLKYDRLMREHEDSYSCLRKLLNELRQTQTKIEEHERRKKEMQTIIEKNTCTLNEMDNMIIDLTNKIDTTNSVSNKMNQYEHVGAMGSISVLQCIQLNKDLHNVEKKIKSYERKIDIIENVKGFPLSPNSASSGKALFKKEEGKKNSSKNA
ncbi:hypothetical protein PCYB_051880 [Plasmodium cynomolgi strain B]|uniref:Uncharacterized protein n=1 Tax=Plasmodium cynomolgi (strain B) TaxID=1120755 RepID=K6UT11_PLACD|nr:hypothetical protein PCYB_051880 [Plasmodium cynomolgi strain B]GAB65170.1 hypothetical protein PCYB_051880 [Plasmodium cynomolgi strain B]